MDQFAQPFPAYLRYTIRAVVTITMLSKFFCRYVQRKGPKWPQIFDFELSFYCGPTFYRIKALVLIANDMTVFFSGLVLSPTMDRSSGAVCGPLCSNSQSVYANLLVADNIIIYDQKCERCLETLTWNEVACHNIL